MQSVQHTPYRVAGSQHGEPLHAGYIYGADTVYFKGLGCRHRTSAAICVTGLLDASPKVQASAVTVLCQALAVPRLGAETRTALLVSSYNALRGDPKPAARPC